MKPLVISEGRYFTKRASLKQTKTVHFELYEKEIKIKDAKTGEQIDSLNISEIKNAKSGGFMWMGSLRFDYGAENGYRVLQFVKTSYLLFGIIGIMLSGGLKTAKLWKEKLAELGVHFSK